MTSVIEVARPASPERAVVTEADVLERAADLLEEFGWCQHWEARNDEGDWCSSLDAGAQDFCIGGAVRRAVVDFGGSRDESPYDRFRGIVQPRWNDDPRRTKGEVVARLREAAASLREAQA